MLEMAFRDIINISVSLLMAYTAVWNFIRLGYWIKCFKVKTCTSKQCRFRRSCSKWTETYTKREKEELLHLIEQHRKRLEGQ
ncbi:MAG TPA: hypothetical protein DCZ40_08865 [Lachnospiraceae bacterium]|nr:hypothetical protein [Lachnospiraceae bacterium]